MTPQKLLFQNLTHKLKRGDISTDPIRKDEIKSALKRLKNGKAPGIDNIPGELLNVDPENTVNELESLFNAIWEREEIPAD